MLSVFKRLLGHAAPETPASPTRALRSLPHRYHPGLIAALQEQHKVLLQLFADLERASEQENESAWRTALERFAGALNDHLTIENRCLYGYFARSGHPDPDIAGRIETMATDMMHVGRILHRFLARYSQAPFEAGQLAPLRADLRAVGEVLAHRIHEEESVLYPLYVPPAAGTQPAARTAGNLDNG